MDVSVILKLLGSELEPAIESLINNNWGEIDKAIAGISNVVAKDLFEVLSPSIKSFVIVELKRYLLASAA